MSGPRESRAAVFTHQPQAVEVYQAGTWWAGELLGWRHEPDGSCRMCVRVVLGGAAETAWVELAGLRLPEPHAPAGPGAGLVPSARTGGATTLSRDGSTTQKLPRAGASRPERPGPGIAANGMPATRTLAAAPPAPSGRRRAVEEPGTSALAAQPPLRAGGRRRAPEAADQPGTTATAEPAGSAPRADVATGAAPPPAGGGRRRAPEGAGRAEPLTDAVPAAGRHRPAPPAGQGRHRTADTGMFGAVQVAAPATPASGGHPVGRAPSTQVPRPSAAGRARWEATAGTWGALGDAEPELLTRPMRLSDSLPGARRSVVDAR